MRKVACITLAVLLALSLAAPALACGGKATLVKTGPLSCLPAGVAYVKPVLADLPDGRVVLGLALTYPGPGGADEVAVIPACDVPEVPQEYACVLSLDDKQVEVVALRDALKQLREYDHARVEAENRAIREMLRLDGYPEDILSSG
ncbi:MAG: hypothetical protein XD69_0179 [Clostridia bacterium 62_21]|nr:MAG: hypothetical protein XD69_0179 [Clostridia bacterium 62_21]HAG07064.1 hypothetical protein [Peptococcaceae bacterium]